MWILTQRKCLCSRRLRVLISELWHNDDIKCKLQTGCLVQACSNLCSSFNFYFMVSVSLKTNNVMNRDRNRAREVVTSYVKFLKCCQSHPLVNSLSTTKSWAMSSFVWDLNRKITWEKSSGGLRVQSEFT